MSRRKHVHEEEHENHERWLITYADMITLLMAFFVMMYGMSILDLKKFADFKAGTAKQLGKSPVVNGGEGILFGGLGIAEAAAAPITGSGPRSGSDDARVSGTVTKEHIGELVKEVQQQLAKNNLQGTVQAEVDPRGAILRLGEQVLFESGSASMSDEGLQVLDQLALVLAPIENNVVVEGHTDDVPTKGAGGFPTNWELSTSRATQVLRWLVQGRHLAAPLFSAAGYADTHPRFLNDTPEHRAANRRVEIVVLVAPDAPPATTTTTEGAPGNG
jgi:chemotaxis protein MotB